ncbi:GtrA family protein [Rhodococcus sp. Q]|uniref:GtrA family protein n=1 Tax=Rhodococcus sp. Q TaxID=2502252 RepID=UPI0024B596CE|nr:GtrA family protein [Rhodococcus sp. Q]
MPENHEPHVPTAVDLPLRDESGEPGVDLKTQILRFAVTGGLSAIVDFGLLVVMLKLGLPFVVAKSISFVAGTTTAYLLNRRWTFSAEPSRARFVAVVLLYGVTFAVQVGISTILNQQFPDDAWWRVPLAFCIAQGTATVINFIVQRAVIFKIR